ncbi:C40 family peptidase [Tessaracoccus sp. MC1865]|uniref:C40 family peptidase n=1 Tax=Tessaracoccus sp. MC1865 TaxID=2760310 RepID=UPI0016047D37|nr:C40 family peptidase [Tessaracoccus sp. MC1865]MBB1483003.1 C40 family peptidase [Tessaracoccus sp. MC1865]QTO37561.1 C40 family peptidase [Tessaracoccus sp. MC1865]
MLKRAIHLLVAAVMAVTLSVAYGGDAQAAGGSVYTQPGHHLVNGRYWRTNCEMYSPEVVRCSTDIWATSVVNHQGRFVTHDGWVFNTLTYLPSDRASWGSNPLAQAGSWTGTDGRRWKTECDTAATGRGACRSYAVTTTIETATGTYTSAKAWVINNIVQFSTASVPAVTKIPAAAPALSWVPVEKSIPDVTVGQQVAKAALTKVGSAYRYANAGPSTFDCSGLTSWAYKQVGVTLPRTSSAQISVGKRVAKSELQPGDLVFYYSPISHVGIYIGNGQIVDAANPSTGVRVASLHSMPFAGATRVVGA